MELQKEGGRRLLLWYLRRRGGELLRLTIYGFIFLLVFYLYRQETEAVLYAGMLCVLLEFVFLLFDFSRFLMVHREKQILARHVEWGLSTLPKAKSLEEDDDQRLLLLLGKQYREAKNAWQREQQESMDYYTAWVHQIKTPLAVMRMVLKAEDTKEHRELLEELFRMEHYVDMALCYQRLSGTGTDFLFRELSLDAVIRQAVRRFAPQFIRRRIRLQYEGTGLWVVTDEKWLQFLLEQLLSNALKYTEQGGISITVDEQEACLYITDTGIGIAPEDLPRIFERGFTGVNGRADKKATGLGLYLCRRIAKNLMIEIHAESTLGEGSTFFLRFCGKRPEKE